MRRSWWRRQAFRDGPTKDVASGEAIRRLRTRDISLRVPSKNGLLRVSFCNTWNVLRETIIRHALLCGKNDSVSFLQMVGTNISFANLLASLQSGEERVEVQLIGEEVTVSTEALALGECRCYIRPGQNHELSSTGVTPFHLRVNRILYGEHEAFVSLTSARLDEIITGQDSAKKYMAQPITSCDADRWAAPPLELGIDGIPSSGAINYFHHNMTLHGYNYFRRSDGNMTAICLMCHVDAVPLREQGLLDSSDVSVYMNSGALSEGSGDGNAKVDVALSSPRHCSVGVLVQPLAAGSAVERDIWKIQRALTRASIVSPGGALSSEAGLLLARAQNEHTACQDWLSLVTGDYEGSFASAVAARQFVHDPLHAAAVIEPIRTRLGIADIRYDLDAAAAERTSIDFFCRCSKGSALEALRCATMDTLLDVKRANSLRCVFCGKQHAIMLGDLRDVGAHGV